MTTAPRDQGWVIFIRHPQADNPRLEPGTRSQGKNKNGEEENRRDIDRAAPHDESAERLHRQEEPHNRECKKKRRKRVSGGRDGKNQADREHHKKDNPQRHKQKPLTMHGRAEGGGRAIHATMVARGG